jgi:hypothetical protein
MLIAVAAILVVLLDVTTYGDATAGANSATFGEPRKGHSLFLVFGARPYNERDLILTCPGARQEPRLFR